MFKRKTLFTSLACGLALLLLVIPCLISFYNANNVKANTSEKIRTVEVNSNQIDYNAFFSQFDDLSYELGEAVSTLNFTENVSAELLEEINNVSLANHEQGKIFYGIEYDQEKGKVFLNSTVYLDDEGNTIFEQVEGVPCWNEITQSVDVVFEVDGEIIFLSELDESIDNCGWFKKALKFVKKNAVAIVAAVAVVAVVATVVVAAPAFVAAATTAMSVSGGTAALAGGIGAGLAAANTAVLSSTLVTAAAAIATVTTGAVLTACILDDIITLTDTYVTDFADSVGKTNRADRYILVVLEALDQPLVTHYKPVTLETAKTWFSLGGHVWTPYSNDAVALIESCGYAAGDSNGNIGMCEQNNLQNGLWGYFHYHAINKMTKEKVRLPGNGQNANVGKPHAVHCFFYF